MLCRVGYRGSISVWSRVFSSLKHQVWPWGTPSLQSIMYGAVSVGMKRIGSKMIYLNLSSEFKKNWSHTSTNIDVFMVWCLIQ